MRFLTPLHGKAKEKPVIAFDVETYGTKNKFVLGVVSYPHESLVFDDPAEMLNDISHHRNRHHLIYATNLHFDIFTLFQSVTSSHALPDGWSAFDNGAKLIWCKRDIRTDTEEQNRFITLLDSLNLFPLGVYNLGGILQKISAKYRRAGDELLANYYNVQKLDAPNCMGKKSYANLNATERHALIEYCRADAEVTRKFMEWANREIINLGAIPKITAASTAMDLFRRKYLHSVIPQPSWECLVESRFSYYGGRTEDYWKGNVGEAVEHDVTAMYPDAMQRIDFPYPSPENFTRVDKPSESVLEHEGFARVSITVPDDCFYPPLPFKSLSHLLFPVGTLEGIWTHLQIRWALQQNCQLNSIDWSYYNTHTFNPFRPYVSELIKLRLRYLCPGCERSDQTGRACWEDGVKCTNADSIEEVIKLFLNGLYGKFAQNFLTEEEAEQYKLYVKKGGGTFKPIGEASMQEFEYTLQHHPDYIAKGIVINKAVPSLKNFMNPILASYITSAAQVKINDFQIKAHKLNIPTYYTDTDSMYNPKRLPFAISGKVLGELQASKPVDELIIVGPKAKMTRTKDSSKPTFKGVPSKSWIVSDASTMEQTPTAPRADIFKSMQHDELKVKYTRFAKHREAMIRGLSANEMIEVTKEFKPFANPKRRILGKPTIKSLLTQSYESRPWKIDAKTQQVIP